MGAKFISPLWIGGSDCVVFYLNKTDVFGNTDHSYKSLDLLTKNLAKHPVSIGFGYHVKAVYFAHQEVVERLSLRGRR